MPGVSVPQVVDSAEALREYPNRPSRAELRADRQARAAVATLQILTGAVVAAAAAIGGSAVLVAVVVVQLGWVAVAGRLLGVTYSGRAVILAAALTATAAVEWEIRFGTGRPEDPVPERIGVLAALLALLVVAAVFVQLARRGGRADLTVRLAGTVLVAVLAVLPAALTAASESAAGRSGIVVLAAAVALAGAATGLGVGELGSGGLGSGAPEPATSRTRTRASILARIRVEQRSPIPVRSRIAGGAGAVAAAVIGAAAATLDGVDAVGINGVGDVALAAGVAAYAVLGVAGYLSSLAAGTIARATPTTRTGGVVAASLAVALGTPLLLAALWVIR